MLSLARLGKRAVVSLTWNAMSSGNTISNQFLNSQSSSSAPSTTESSGQTCAGVNFALWRFQGAFTGAGVRQATMTVRINGVSQASTATVVGTAAGAVNTDLATALQITSTDMLGVLFTTTVADASNTRPRAALIGAARVSL